MALSAESASATISMAAMTQLRNSPPTPGKTLPAKLTKIVFGSAREGVGQCLGAQHDDEGDGHQRINEHAVAAFEIHGDLGVTIGVGAFADVAGGGLHRDHVPGQQEAIGDIDLDPVEAADGRRRSSSRPHA